jgi:hypothetical protein
MEPPDFLKRIIDFDRLMEGENRATTDADDVAHWTAVYKDMVAFKERLLRETREHIEKVPETNSELGANDIPFLEEEMKRLRRGLAFWESRQAKD